MRKSIPASKISEYRSGSPDVCAVGFDPEYFSGHPQCFDPGYEQRPWEAPLSHAPSVAYLYAAIHEANSRGELALAYHDLIEWSGLHEARLTWSLLALLKDGRLCGKGVCFMERGPEATMYRDYIVHYFWLPTNDPLRRRNRAEPHPLDKVESRLIEKRFVLDPRRPLYRTPIDARTRAVVWDKSAGRCWYCGALLAESFHVDHVVAHGLGGSDEIDNLVAACILCNLSKHMSTVDEFRQRRGGGPFWFEAEGLDR